MARSNLILHARTTSILKIGITTIKIHQNSVKSSLGARYVKLDIKDFYLNSKLEEFEYMKLCISLILEEFVQMCDLESIVNNNSFIYMKI